MDLGLSSLVFFLLLSLGASTVNGALGYGFSSISVPLAILLFPNRIINPAYILAELPLNAIILVLERKQIRATFSRSLPIILSLFPGVAAGSFLLASVSSIWVRMLVYAILLPLVVVQAAGFRRPIRSERAITVPFGAGVGAMYSLTTISGPPLALFLNNQGLEKHQFRATLAQIRIAEGLSTAIAYYTLGLFSPIGLQISAILLLPMVIGIPLGRLVIHRIHLETFRRICMSFDALIIGFGISQTMIALHLTSVSFGYAIFAIVVLIDSWLLYRYLYRARVTRLAFEVPSVLKKQLGALSISQFRGGGSW